MYENVLYGAFRGKSQQSRQLFVCVFVCQCVCVCEKQKSSHNQVIIRCTLTWPWRGGGGGDTRSILENPLIRPSLSSYDKYQANIPS